MSIAVGAEGCDKRGMTEWNASGYFEQSALQRRLAETSLAGLVLEGSERVLDVGCGDGKITAGIAERLPRGSVVGIDPSGCMIDFARERFRATHPNLLFEVGDAARLGYRAAFDVVVSFNALHWVQDQAAALRGIHGALVDGGRGVLQFVPGGERPSLEDVIEQTRTSPLWARYFEGYRPPYVHPVVAEYRSLAEESGLGVESVDTRLERWDFGSRGAFVDFARVTFVEWTKRLPVAEVDAFVVDALDRYRRVGDGTAADADVFHFYQMRVGLRRARAG
jgi:trans-aconitate 2-methyltransferase